MDVREPRSVEEFRDGERVIADAWQAAFSDIVSEEAIRYIDDLPSTPRLFHRYHRVSRGDDIVCLLADDDGAVVGSATVVWGPERTKDFAEPEDAELQTLYVHPDRWGAGIGTTLLEEAVARIPATATRLVLETFSANAIGRQFYEARGFELAGSWSFAIAGNAYPTVVYARSR